MATGVMTGCNDAIDASAGPTEAAATEMPVIWSHSGAESEVGQVTSNDGDEIPVEFVVPADAAAGTATVRVDTASLDLEVER